MSKHWTPAAPTPAPRADANAIDVMIPGGSAGMRRLKRLIAAVADSDAPALVTGPTGAGKELVARALHRLSGRRGELVAVNCAAVPAELLESELFGHEKGAFTGADRPRAGLIEQAEGGTLFLDEIGDMPLALQAKLLRALETRRVRRVGGAADVPVNFRLVSATHQGLEGMVEAGRFRLDLYYRLAVFPLEVPPLAKRTEDLPEILSRLIAEETEARPLAPAPVFDASALRALAAHGWPGNVRELKNIVQRAFALFGGRVVGARQVTGNLLTLAMPEPEDETSRWPSPPAPVGDAAAAGFLAEIAEGVDLDLRGYLRDIEVTLIEAALAQSGGCVSKAAAALRLRRTTLIEKMKKHGVSRG